MQGVTIVVCCHNSASRLPATLTHLVSQDVRQDELAWEVLLVDNASTDATADVARALWTHDAPAPLRIIYEPRPGLTCARRTGMKEARFDIVSFIDDDNWVATDWVRNVFCAMSEQPYAGAIGAHPVEAISTIPLPFWFSRFSDCYAVGRQADTSCDVTWGRGFLWGAGLSIRKSAWQSLLNNGFVNILQDRTGTALNAGGDTELCYALRLTGWRLWYDERLRLKHFMEPRRLNWNYLRRLCRAFGASRVMLDFYTPWTTSLFNTSLYTVKELWKKDLVSSVRRFIRISRRIGLFDIVYSAEGDSRLLRLERELGRITTLCNMRSQYPAYLKRILYAPWRLPTASLLTNDALTGVSSNEQIALCRHLGNALRVYGHPDAQDCFSRANHILRQTDALF